ncbi:MAG TPA: right-handed parallel beta-helix repeat-containing protein, partial [Thermomicrobiaceae bacterium]|nr:right-handed parallel beta-helix repeat-containing protein [Thermomicrobiaceae bacterium]
MGITMGRSRLGMALGIAAVLLLALGALAWTIGTTKLALADTPTTTYTQCPSYRQFQYDVEQVQPYQSGTFIFPPNCSYDPSSTPSGVTSSLRFNGEATVKIEGNGLTISGSTTTTPGSFDLISFLADDQMPLTTLELDGVTLELGANCINTGSNEGIESIDLTLVDTTLSDCQSDGVLDSNVGSTNITVSDSTFYHNGQSGIDIDSNDNDPSTQVNLSITGSTFGLNGSSGINLDTSATTSNLNLTNSTLAGNNSSGIQLASYGRHVTANLTYDTIANDGIYGIFNSNIGEGYAVTLAGTIISGNLDNCFQPVTDGGFNFEGSAHGTQNSCDFSGSTRGSRAVTDAALGLQPLADNGGPTQTMALDTNLPSVAINAIPSADCATIIDPITNLPVTADQRGVPRPQGAGCDSGAYEAITVPYTVTYSSCPTQAGLQNDFDLAASTSGNPLTIDVTQPNCIIPVASAFNDPALGPTAFEIPKGANVTLNGDGLALAGSSGNISIIDAGSSASLTVNGVTFEGGSYGITANGSSITVSDSTFTRDPVGIGNTGGTVTVTDSTFSNDGEGIIGTNSTVTVTGSTFTGMKSGIDDTQNSSTLTTTVVNSTFSGDGFGIYDRDGTTRVISSTFDDNSLSDIYSNSYMPAVFTASIL